jgi:hypothetical protein
MTETCSYPASPAFASGVVREVHAEALGHSIEGAAIDTQHLRNPGPIPPDSLEHVLAAAWSWRCCSRALARRQRRLAGQLEERLSKRKTVIDRILLLARAEGGEILLTAGAVGLAQLAASSSSSSSR